MRRAFVLVVAVLALLTAGSAISAKEFKAKYNALPSAAQEAADRWFNHLAFQAWLDGLNQSGFYDPLQCGGDLPPCYVMERESGGNPLAVYPGHAGAPDDPGDPLNNASGKWQFMPGTWNNYLGYPYAAAAPVRVQDAKAREVWAGGAGQSHWSMTL